MCSTFSHRHCPCYKHILGVNAEFRDLTPGLILRPLWSVVGAVSQGRQRRSEGGRTRLPAGFSFFFFPLSTLPLSILGILGASKSVLLSPNGPFGAYGVTRTVPRDWMVLYGLVLYCIRTLLRGGTYWEIHPPSTEIFPKVPRSLGP